MEETEHWTSWGEWKKARRKRKRRGIEIQNTRMVEFNEDIELLFGRSKKQNKPKSSDPLWGLIAKKMMFHSFYITTKLRYKSSQIWAILGGKRGENIWEKTILIGVISNDWYHYSNEPAIMFSSLGLFRVLGIRKVMNTFNSDNRDITIQVKNWLE